MSHGNESPLTDGQKACLNLVNAHLTSKQIARQLGISPFTVDQRLDAARRKLRASSRRDAARIFAEMHDNIIYERLVYEPEPIAENIVATNDPNAPKKAVQRGLTLSRNHSFRAEHALLFSIFAVPPMGGKRHDYSKREIVVQSLNIAFYSAMVVGMIILTVTGTMQIVQ